MGQPAVSIDWGAWDEVGAAVRHGVLGRAAGIGLRSIAPAEGLALLARIFAGAAAQVAVLPVDWRAFLDSRIGPVSPVYERMVHRLTPREGRVAVNSPAPVSAAAPSTASSTPAVGILQRLTDSIAARRPAVLRAFLRERVAHTLGLTGGRTVDDRQPLRDVGLDSLLAIELRNVLGAAIHRPLPATLLFDHPTIDDLATHLMHLLFPDDAIAATMPATTPARGMVASVLSDVSTMSDDEVERLLAARRTGRA